MSIPGQIHAKARIWAARDRVFSSKGRNLLISVLLLLGGSSSAASAEYRLALFAQIIPTIRKIRGFIIVSNVSILYTAVQNNRLAGEGIQLRIGSVLQPPEPIPNVRRSYTYP
jgi:hypothetical protein